MLIGQGAHAAGSDVIRVGLIGCGGRGTGAANDCLTLGPDVKIVALGDLFQDRLDGCFNNLTGKPEAQETRWTFAKERCFVGLRRL